MYKLLMDEGVVKGLGDLQQYQAKIFRQIVLKIFSLGSNPRPHDSKKIEDGYRVDTGEFRIIYEVDDKVELVTIRIIGKRNDDEIYKRMKRKLG